MWFLIKTGFWFSLVLVMLPFFDPASTRTLENGPKVDVGDTVSAATQAFGYISAICSEKPDVCDKGSETFVALGHRAREGARIAYQFLGERFAEPGDAVMTGTIGKPADADRPLPVTVEQAIADAQDMKATPEPSFAKIPVPEPRIEPKKG